MRLCISHRKLGKVRSTVKRNSFIYDIFSASSVFFNFFFPSWVSLIYVVPPNRDPDNSKTSDHIKIKTSVKYYKCFLISSWLVKTQYHTRGRRPCSLHGLNLKPFPATCLHIYGNICIMHHASVDIFACIKCKLLTTSVVIHFNVFSALASPLRPGYNCVS